MPRYRWPPGIHAHHHTASCHDRCPPMWAEHLHTHLHRMEHVLMATQADVDAIATELSDAADELASGIQNLEDQIAALPAGSDVDVTALKATADKLKGIADSVPQATPPADPPPAG